MINDARLTELAIRVMSDETRHHHQDTTYLVAQTRDNQESVLCGCLMQWGNPRDPRGWPAGVPRVLISNNTYATETISGYPGAPVWKKELIRFGFRADDIQTFDVHGPANTLTELAAMVDYTKKNGWSQIRLIAAPFHQLRAFMTVVSVLLKEYPELRVYNSVGCTLDWNEPVKHSQNESSTRRSDVIAKEIKRIHVYHEKGDLVDVETVLEYLDQRDRA